MKSALQGWENFIDNILAVIFRNTLPSPRFYDIISADGETVKVTRSVGIRAKREWRIPIGNCRVAEGDVRNIVSRTKSEILRQIYDIMQSILVFKIK